MPDKRSLSRPATCHCRRNSDSGRRTQKYGGLKCLQRRMLQMEPAPVMTDRPAAPKARRAARGGLARGGERIIEALIYLCGFSSIIFVFGIFFFVFKEGAPFLAKLNFWEFL